MDLSAFVDPDSVISPEDTKYELKSIVIHRGGPYGGHYHAYIKDDLTLGVWDI